MAVRSRKTVVTLGIVASLLAAFFLWAAADPNSEEFLNVGCPLALLALWFFFKEQKDWVKLFLMGMGLGLVVYLARYANDDVYNEIPEFWTSVFVAGFGLVLLIAAIREGAGIVRGTVGGK